MLDPRNVDFKGLGFHAGIEVHHQIRSQRKLFCSCPPVLEDDPKNMDYSFYRYFRPVLGEMGDFDPGMLVEFEKGYRVIYFACERNTCTYEMDETPPFFPDMKAIEEGFVLALYFNCSALAEEVVVNRKQYLDGSITTGFQRTFIVGRDGWVPVNGKKVRISNVHIEEDAARRVNWYDTASRTVYFNLDRLGIPLTEVISDHRDVESPEELVELAKQIGRVLRVSRIGRRGIGVVRQDVNLSIEGGNRAEIKGVQDLSMFDLMCRREVVRQHALIEISRRMKDRGIRKDDFEHTYVDVSHLFELGDNKAFATVFPNMKGIFGMEVQPDKDFGLEVFEKSMLITGIAREDHFHSDETEENAVRKRSDHPCRLLIDEKRIAEIRAIISPKREDAFVIVVGPEKRAMHAMKKIVERLKMALDGVPMETRKLLPSGNTEFLRVIHGKERIYPDTDTPPVVIPSELVDDCRKKVGKRPWEILEELHSKHHLDQNQVDLLIREEKVEKFCDYTQRLGLKGSSAYYLLIELPRSSRRKGIKISDRIIDELASHLSEKLMNYSQIDSLIKILGREPKLSIEEALRKLPAVAVDEATLDRIVFEKLTQHDLSRIASDEAYRNHMVPRIVGEVLKSFNHSVEGRRVFERVQSLLHQRMNEDGGRKQR
ncbi:MAG: Glu-tRNA(Gln) amidotransferase subunit GatE [Candidatus Bathyarchaeia archaeon]